MQKEFKIYVNGQFYGIRESISKIYVIESVKRESKFRDMASLILRRGFAVIIKAEGVNA